MIIFFGWPSQNPEDYSYFGSYISGLGSILTLCVIIFYYLDRVDQAKNIDLENRRRNIQYFISIINLSSEEERVIEKYCQTIEKGEIDTKSQQWKTDHYEYINLVKKRIQVLYDLICSDELKKDEIDLYKIKVQMQYRKGLRDSIYKIMKDDQAIKFFFE